MSRIWIFVIVSFLLLISAWSTIIYIAVKHSPERIPVENSDR